ncbi:hypothetical protein [Undibacterium sp. RuTC16W]|uniref:hypothetical protein n=1 Tax=Undibacterium sp. RuTC16W TaxID=3413048 RepID=UPI003BF37084
MRERPVSSVPGLVIVLLLSVLCSQLAWRFFQPSRQAQVETLLAPPAFTTLNLMSAGEPIAMAKTLTLYLQAFDNQAGLNVSLAQFDYTVVRAWLARSLELDPAGQYPLFVASRLYGEIADQSKQRLMLEFVYQAFLQDPDRRWAALAHATFLAKHRLNDLPLAVKYANALRTHVGHDKAPHWVTQMEIFLLEDINELQSAQILLGSLLQNGQITDPHELHFLEQRLLALERKVAAP